MGSTYTMHNDTDYTVYVTHGAQKDWKFFPGVKLVQEHGGNSAYKPEGSDTREVAPGGEYVVNCTLSLVNTVYMTKEVTRGDDIKFYQGDQTVWSGATANSNNNYYVSNTENWSLQKMD